MTLPPYARLDAERESTPETADAAKMLTRRAVLVRAGGVGLSSFTLAGLLAACGSGNQSSGSTSSGSKAAGEAPGRGGTLTLAVDGTNGIADPAFYTTLGDWMAVDCICRGLTFIDFSDTTPKPDLAERWEISDDGRIYRFFLREGVKFHDDTTLSSKDVVRSLERQLNPKDPTLPPGGSGPFFTAVGDNIKSMKAVDDMTVEFKLKLPDALLLAKLSDIGGRVISSAALEKYKKDIGTHLTGTGPFRLVDARQGEAMTMEAFEGYKDGRPPIDRLVLQQAQDPSTIVGSLIGGQISATQFTPYSALEDLKTNDKVTVYDTKRGLRRVRDDGRPPARDEGHRGCARRSTRRSTARRSSSRRSSASPTSPRATRSRRRSSPMTRPRRHQHAGHGGGQEADRGGRRQGQDRVGPGRLRLVAPACRADHRAEPQGRRARRQVRARSTRARTPGASSTRTTRSTT